MAILDEIQIAKEIGRIGTNRFIWYACANCGKERWVQLRDGKPRHLLCHSCANRITGFAHAEEKSNSWRGGINHTDGYILLYTPQHPQANYGGYVKRAILVLEEKLGRPLRGGMVSHHKNGIKDDDRPENLEELSKSEHMRLHHPKGSKWGRNTCVRKRICGILRRQQCQDRVIKRTKK